MQWFLGKRQGANDEIPDRCKPRIVLSFRVSQQLSDLITQECKRRNIKLLLRQQGSNGVQSAYVFVNERAQPFGRMGIARMMERTGEAAKLPFPVHVHMLRHSTGYALAGKGMDTRRLQHFLGHASITNTVRYTAMSPEPFKDVWR